MFNSAIPILSLSIVVCNVASLPKSSKGLSPDELKCLKNLFKGLVTTLVVMSAGIKAIKIKLSIFLF